MLLSTVLGFCTTQHGRSSTRRRASHTFLAGFDLAKNVFNFPSSLLAQATVRDRVGRKLKWHDRAVVSGSIDMVVERRGGMAQGLVDVKQLFQAIEAVVNIWLAGP